jgi:hypothetical protein
MQQEEPMLRRTTHLHTLSLVFLLGLLVDSHSSRADSTSGRYSQLATDTLISASEVILLTATITLTSVDNVFVESDGRYFASSSNALGLVTIRIDGTDTGNPSIINWAGSISPQQHSFNAIAVKSLGAGPHTITLVAKNTAGAFYVGASSNLSVLIHPATQAFMQQPGVDTAQFDFTTKPVGQFMSNYGALPHVSVTSRTLNSGGSDIVALASGRSYVSGVNGDAMWGIYFDGTWIGFQGNYGSTKTLWTVNDLCSCAEVQGPMYTHAFFPAPTNQNHTISLDATEYPWGPNDNGGEDTVQYKVGGDTALVVLAGGMTNRGSQHVLLSGFADAYPIGPVPPGGTKDTKVADKLLTTTTGHGTIMFTAKARIQATGMADNGTVILYIMLDGALVGSYGVQTISSLSGISQRTMSASYLAINLPAATHHVEVHTQATGTFTSTNNAPFIHTEIPLVYFD